MRGGEKRVATTRRKPTTPVERPDGRLPPKKQKELKAVEIGAKIFVELYGPALKELEKY